MQRGVFPLPRVPCKSGGVAGHLPPGTPFLALWGPACSQPMGADAEPQICIRIWSRSETCLLARPPGESRARSRVEFEEPGLISRGRSPGKTKNLHNLRSDPASARKSGGRFTNIYFVIKPYISGLYSNVTVNETFYGHFYGHTV